MCNALGETIGVNNNVQICTNNVLSMRNVVDLIIHHSPSLYFQVCVVHLLDVLLEDWGKQHGRKELRKMLFLSYNNTMHH